MQEQRLSDDAISGDSDSDSKSLISDGPTVIKKKSTSRFGGSKTGQKEVLKSFQHESDSSPDVIKDSTESLENGFWQ